MQQPDDLLRLLKHFGFTDQDISEGTRTDSRTVRRWKMAEPGTTAAGRLAEIRNVVLLLRDTGVLTDRGIVFWMRHPNRLLEDYSPMAVVGAGGFRAALEAAKCFSDSERVFDEVLPASVLELLQKQEAPKRKPKTGSRLRDGSKLDPVSS